jgi:hypothetical protein
MSSSPKPIALACMDTPKSSSNAWNTRHTNARHVHQEGECHAVWSALSPRAHTAQGLLVVIARPRGACHARRRWRTIHGPATIPNDRVHRPGQLHPGYHCGSSADSSPHGTAASEPQVGGMRRPCPAKSDGSKPCSVAVGSSVVRARAVTRSEPTRSDPACGSCSTSADGDDAKPYKEARARKRTAALRLPLSQSDGAL